MTITVRHLLTTATTVFGLAVLAAAPASASALTPLGTEDGGAHNGCANTVGATSAAASTGDGTPGKTFALPGTAPTNQCGDLGLSGENLTGLPAVNSLLGGG